MTENEVTAQSEKSATVMATELKTHRRSPWSSRTRRGSSHDAI